MGGVWVEMNLRSLSICQGKKAKYPTSKFYRESEMGMKDRRYDEDRHDEMGGMMRWEV